MDYVCNGNDIGKFTRKVVCNMFRFLWAKEFFHIEIHRQFIEVYVDGLLIAHQRQPTCRSSTSWRGLNAAAVGELILDRWRRNLDADVSAVMRKGPFLFVNICERKIPFSAATEFLQSCQMGNCIKIVGGYSKK
jgi:hypothetical protein